MLGSVVVADFPLSYDLWHFGWSCCVQTVLRAARGRFEGLYSHGEDAVEDLGIGTSWYGIWASWRVFVRQVYPFLKFRLRELLGTVCYGYIVNDLWFYRISANMCLS